MQRDVCENRHGGNDASAEAFRRIGRNISEVHRWILGLVRQSDRFGVTLEDIVDAANEAIRKGQTRSGRTEPVTPNDLSGRLTELKAAGLIFPSIWETHRKNRSGNRCTVYVLKEIIPPNHPWHPSPEPAPPVSTAGAAGDQGRLW